jgi:hypothetical protein
VKAREAALRIGQTAAQLGISPHHLRQLCKCGLVEAELSTGGQWRVPMSEIRRLQSEGVPAAPTFIEDDPEPPASAPLPPANRLLASPSPEMVYAVEDAEKATVLAPWERQQAIHKVVESVCGELPYELRSYEQNRVRKNQAAQGARAAIEQLGDVPEWQMKLAGTAAMEPIVAEFEHEQRCAKLASTLPPGLTSDEQADARDKIQDVLSQFPVSTTQRKLEQAREEALARGASFVRLGAPRALPGFCMCAGKPSVFARLCGRCIVPCFRFRTSIFNFCHCAISSTAIKSFILCPDNGH